MWSFLHSFKGEKMILSVNEKNQLFTNVIDDILKERGSAICLTDALDYADKAVVAAMLTGKSNVTLDLSCVVQTAEAQKEVKALFKEFSQDFITELGLKAIDEQMYPDIKKLPEFEIYAFSLLCPASFLLELAGFSFGGNHE